MRNNSRNPSNLGKLSTLSKLFVGSQTNPATSKHNRIRRKLVVVGDSECEKQALLL